MRSSRGFTLLEIMIATAIVAILAALGAWSVDRLVTQSRVDTAARNLLLDIRYAQSLATRTNSVVQLTYRRDPVEGCAGASYAITGTEIGAINVRYKTICIPDSYPQVYVGADSAPADFGNLACVNDSTAIAAPPLAADGCSFCGGTNTGTLRFLPSGEVIPQPAASPVGVESLAFTWREGAPPGVVPEPPVTRVRVVTLTTAGGRGRLLRPAPTDPNNAAAPWAWECR